MRGTITIDGKKVEMEANAATPVFYRRRFHSDFLIEMQKLAEDLKLTGEIKNLEPIENLAYLMAWQADPDNTPGTIEEWLAGFDPLSIYLASPEIFRFWNLSAGKTAELKKKAEREIDRPLTVGLYLLRCKELNLSIEDLEKVDYGMILDMLIEKANDSYEYDYLANEDDYKNF